MKILRYISVFVIALLLAGELLCRVKLFSEKKDIYYLTAPFLQKIAVAVDKGAQEQVFIHDFNNEEYRLSLKNMSDSRLIKATLINFIVSSCRGYSWRCPV